MTGNWRKKKTEKSAIFQDLSKLPKWTCKFQGVSKKDYPSITKKYETLEKGVLGKLT